MKNVVAMGTKDLPNHSNLQCSERSQLLQLLFCCTWKLWREYRIIKIMIKCISIFRICLVVIAVVSRTTAVDPNMIHGNLLDESTKGLGKKILSFKYVLTLEHNRKKKEMESRRETLKNLSNQGLA